MVLSLLLYELFNSLQIYYFLSKDAVFKYSAACLSEMFKLLPGMIPYTSDEFNTFT